MSTTPARHPRLFLDVDGVLNPFELGLRRELAGFDDFDDFDVHEIDVELEAGHARTFMVLLSPAMAERLAGLDADISWATTWEHRADTAIAQRCGLPRGLPVLTRPSDCTDRWGGWKFHAVRRSVESDPRPFVWLDDDLDTFGDDSMTAREWAAGITTPNLLIAPDARRGLLPHDLDLVEEFLTRHTDPESRRSTMTHGARRA